MGRPPLLLVNPAAASGRGASRLKGLAEPAGVQTVVTRDAADLTERARLAAEEGRDRVIVAGGDGTVHYAVRALAGTDCALGLVPTGSGNDLARVMGLEFDPARALATAVSGRPKRVDVGYVDGLPFAGVVGLGFVGEVNQYANERTGWPQGRWTYPYAVLRTLHRFQPPVLRLEHDDEYDHPEKRPAPHQPRQPRQVEPQRREREDDDRDRAHHHLGGPGAAHEKQDAVENERHDQYVDQVHDRERDELDVEQFAHHAAAGSMADRTVLILTVSATSCTRTIRAPDIIA